MRSGFLRPMTAAMPLLPGQAPLVSDRGKDIVENTSAAPPCGNPAANVRWSNQAVLPIRCPGFVTLGPKLFEGGSVIRVEPCWMVLIQANFNHPSGFRRHPDGPVRPRQYAVFSPFHVYFNQKLLPVEAITEKSVERCYGDGLLEAAGECCPSGEE